MRIQGVSHLGIAVTRLAEQVPFYRDVLGLEYVGQEEVADQKVRVAVFRAGDVRIELLEPTAPDSPIARFIEKRGQGIHHVAYAVNQLEESLEELKGRGIQLIDESPRPGAEGHRIAFVHPRATFGVLTELCEPTQNRES